MSDAVEIEGFLRDEGFSALDAATRARSLLEQHGLTRPGKRAMAADKIERARMILSAEVVKVCESLECRRLAAINGSAGLPPLTVDPAACVVCGGSNNRRGAIALAHRMHQLKLDRLLVVGGTPTLHTQIDQLLTPRGIRTRFVDGATGSHSLKDALPNMQWAQIVVIWGASPLPHKVSNLYTTAPPEHVKVVKFARRGIEAMCSEVLRGLS